MKSQSLHRAYTKSEWSRDTVVRLCWAVKAGHPIGHGPGSGSARFTRPVRTARRGFTGSSTSDQPHIRSISSLKWLPGNLCLLDQVESPCSKVAAKQAIDGGYENDEEGVRDNVGIEGVHDCVGILCKEYRRDYAERNPTARNEKLLRSRVVRHSLVAKQRIPNKSGKGQGDGPGSHRRQPETEAGVDPGE